MTVVFKHDDPGGQVRAPTPELWPLLSRAHLAKSDHIWLPSGWFLSFNIWSGSYICSLVLYNFKILDNNQIFLNLHRHGWVCDSDDMITWRENIMVTQYYWLQCTVSLHPRPPVQDKKMSQALFQIWTLSHCCAKIPQWLSQVKNEVLIMLGFLLSQTKSVFCEEFHTRLNVNHMG